MVEHRIGRFALAIPPEMDRQGETFELRFSEVKEVDWTGARNPEDARDAAWRERIDELRKLKPPPETKDVILEQRDIPILPAPFEAVRYYGFDYTDERIVWEGLLATDSTGLWIKKDAWQEYENEVLQDLIEIAEAYKPQANGAQSWFHLPRGAIALPYLEQESAYARFEGHPLELELEIQMNSTDEVSNTNLLERLSGAVASGYAPEVNVEQIRTGGREAAGLQGEEAILRLTEDGDSDLSFSWMYTGREDSGDFPKIVLTMRSKDGQLDEKAALWDQILESMRPLGR